MTKTRFPFHLLAVALYPLLFLYIQNLEYVRPLDMARPLVASLLGIGVLLALFSALLKNPDRAAVLVTLLWALFSIYGHVYQALRESSALGRHSLLAPVFALLALAGIAGVWRARGRLAGLSAFLNALLVVLLVLAVFNLGRSAWQRAQSGPSGSNAGRAPLALPGAPARPYPDVYYIILDTYSRADVIQKRIGLDISPFLNQLRQRGFQVADCSQSNYDSTRVSLTSSLNMDYLPALDARFTPDNPDNAIMDDYILHSKVRATFESLGYKTVAFATGFAFTEMTDAGEYLSPPAASVFDPEVRPFEALWLKTTGMRALFDIHPAALAWLLNPLSFPHGEHVRREQFLLDQLPVVAVDPQPTFTFAHVILPHVPFVFRADGSIITDDRYFREMFDQPVSEEYLVDGYRGQVEYINRRMLEIVDEILRNSDRPPVIIIQGDHGLLYAEHHPILNAYYFPDLDPRAIPGNITPVNTFRLLFNTYFAAQMPLLPDVSYSSTYMAPYDFQAASYECPVQ